MTYAVPAGVPEIMAFVSGMWSTFAKRRTMSEVAQADSVSVVLSRSPMRAWGV